MAKWGDLSLLWEMVVGGKVVCFAPLAAVAETDVAPAASAAACALAEGQIKESKRESKRTHREERLTLARIFRTLFIDIPIRVSTGKNRPSS